MAKDLKCHVLTPTSLPSHKTNPTANNINDDQGNSGGGGGRENYGNGYVLLDGTGKYMEDGIYEVKENSVTPSSKAHFLTALKELRDSGHRILLTSNIDANLNPEIIIDHKFTVTCDRKSAYTYLLSALPLPSPPHPSFIETLTSLSPGYTIGDCCSSIQRRTSDTEEGVMEGLAATESTALKGMDVRRVRDSEVKCEGWKDVKEKIKRNIVGSLVHSGRMGISPIRGCCIIGPPGSGKSTFALYTSCLLSLPVITVRSSDVMSKYTGGSEEIMRKIFRRAEEVKPCVVWFKDLEGLVGNRGYGRGEGGGGTVLTTMLNCIDGAGRGGEGIFVIGECERVENLDDALVRGGRMEGRIELGEVGEGWRDILHGEFRDWNMSPALDLDFLSSTCCDFLASEIVTYCNAVKETAIDRVEETNQGGAAEVQECDFRKAWEGFGWAKE